MKHTISIVVHNLLPVTRECIDLVQKHSEDYELIVTDNASTDGTKEWLDELKNKFPEQVTVVHNSVNEGFIVPHNRALTCARGEYFVVLNNDCNVCPHWLTRMREEFEKNPKLALCGVKHGCTMLDEKGIGIPGPNVEYVEGSCLMSKTELLMKHGLFSNEFKFSYYEDSDLGLRMRSLGYDLAAVDIKVRHTGSATARIVKNTVDLEGYKIRNQQVFLRKWETYLKSRTMNQDRIVICRKGARGDVILTTPVIRALKQKHPEKEIIVKTQCPEVFAGNPDVSQAGNEYPINGDREIVFDLNLAYERRPDTHIIQAYAQACGVSLEDWKPKLYFSEQAYQVGLQRVSKETNFVVIHPGMIPGWVGRQWPIQKFEPVVQYLTQSNLTVATVGDDKTPLFQGTLDLRGIPFQQLCAIMARAKLFVGLDSMPLHVAQAFDVPIVAIFGSVRPELRLVPNSLAVGVTAENVGCLGCHHYLPAPRTCTSSCLRGREWCMENISSDQVIGAVQDVLGSPSWLERRRDFVPAPVPFCDDPVRIELSAYNPGSIKRSVYRRLKKNRR